MEKIPTAKQLFDKMLEADEECTSTEMMIEFAKLHVEAALKAALNSVEYADGNDSAVDDIDEESILNSYPLSNIE
jgi:hypothetical protein